MLTVRMSTGEDGRLAGVAKTAKIPVATLARILIGFGLDQLARGNPELDRAIKTSRDA